MKWPHFHYFPVAGFGLVVFGWITPLANAWEPLAVAQDRRLFMPGSQHGSAVLPATSNCTNCHAGFDPVSEPHHKWRGSMMAQATRDPLWLATMAVAAQDSIWALGNPNAADLCLRCHTPTGWLGGRSDPTNGTALTVNTGDYEGVSCASCHHMIDAFPGLNLQPGLPPEAVGSALETAANTAKTRDMVLLSNLRLFNNTAFFNSTTQLPVKYGTVTTDDLTKYIEAGSGQMFIETNNKIRRGPRNDVNPNSHTFLYSRFHKSQAMCRTCHDVSNPVLANLTIGPDASESRSAASYFHVERTSSEFELSAYANPGGAAVDGPLNAMGITQAADCQDCHMPRVAGRFASQGTARTDTASHSMAGGNSWITRMLATVDTGGTVSDSYNRAILTGAKYPGAVIETAGLQGASAALLDGQTRAADLLTRAASIVNVADSPTGGMVRVVNHTGHKLISGFPEGRRMWLHVSFLNAQGDVIGEINPYQPLQVTTDGQGNKQYLAGGDLQVTHGDLVYEANMSSNLTGEQKTFHFVLATDRYKDNRIPPRGFRIADAPERISHPRWHGEDAPDYFSGEEYAGGYDEVSFSKPAGTVGWVSRLFYQTTSKPYVEFLRNEIKGNASTLTLPTPSGEPAAYVVQTDPFFSTLKGWGDAIWDLWLHNGGSAPVLMASAISPPLLKSFGIESGVPTARVATLPGRFYQLERRADLTAGIWTTIGSPFAGNGTEAAFTDPLPPPGAACFYRVRCWTP